jgi:hypothetical protein
MDKLFFKLNYHFFSVMACGYFGEQLFGGVFGETPQYLESLHNLATYVPSAELLAALHARTFFRSYSDV